MNVSPWHNKKRRKLGPQITLPGPESPKPNYNREITDVVDMAILKTVTVEGIHQAEKELVEDAVRELRLQSSLQDNKIFFNPSQAFL